MRYIMSFLERFNCLTVWHLLVIDCDFSRIFFRESTQNWVPGTWFNIIVPVWVCINWNSNQIPNEFTWDMLCVQLRRLKDVPLISRHLGYFPLSNKVWLNMISVNYHCITLRQIQKLSRYKVVRTSLVFKSCNWNQTKTSSTNTMTKVLENDDYGNITHYIEWSNIF